MHRIQNHHRQQDQRNAAGGYERPIGSHTSPKQDILTPYQVLRDPGASDHIVDNPNVYRGWRLHQQATMAFQLQTIDCGIIFVHCCKRLHRPHRSDQSGMRWDWQTR